VGTNWSDVAKASGIHHITLRVSDLDRSRQFYERVLELEADQVFEDKCRFRLPGGTRLSLRLALPGTPANDRFSEFRIGLDHIALGVDTVETLEALVERLQSAGVATEGVQRHPEGFLLVSFRDPDNIQWEYFKN
jgi:glyoxylase I family protein